jgi:leucyl-tRNA synthetase
MAKVNLIIKARYLRHEETKAEKLLWQELRKKNLDVKFRRQHPFDGFILDFYAIHMERSK